jgi:hypothetical protein
MASSPPGLVFKMILSPSAAMSTACASVAHGVVVGSREQAASCHKTKQKKKNRKKVKVKNNERGEKNQNRLLQINCVLEEITFCGEYQQYLNCDGRNLQKKRTVAVWVH